MLRAQLQISVPGSSLRYGFTDLFFNHWYRVSGAAMEKKSWFFFFLKQIKTK